MHSVSIVCLVRYGELFGFWCALQPQNQNQPQRSSIYFLYSSNLEQTSKKVALF